MFAVEGEVGKSRDRCQRDLKTCSTHDFVMRAERPGFGGPVAKRRTGQASVVLTAVPGLLRRRRTALQMESPFLDRGF